MTLPQPPNRMQLNNDIGCFDNIFSPEECQQFIDAYHLAEQYGMTVRRTEHEGNASHHRQDRSMFMLGDMWCVSQSGPLIHMFFDRFWSCYQEYMTHYSVMLESTPHIVTNMKIQKTLPQEGYHVWHYENNRRSAEAQMRITAFMLYLNDVEEGGETEFLYRSLRIKPKAGTLLIWPAGYTHTHRGNPPLNTEKYILTGWTDVA